jgi:hypothetical protein
MDISEGIATAFEWRELRYPAQSSAMTNITAAWRNARKLLQTARKRFNAIVE